MAESISLHIRMYDARFGAADHPRERDCLAS
ncbi:hypothetical protein NB311A_01764 [Nitrobacter sp. Nb-311A]|nr:hypothetical protein NB311A_01764 [Nitrobacter sp. Nb-311A]